MNERKPNLIPRNECEPGWLYRIDGRINDIGICFVDITDKNETKFLVQRTKFRSVFLDPEIHWDCDKRVGTAQPTVKIEKVPDHIWQLMMVDDKEVRPTYKMTLEESGVILAYLNNHPAQIAINQEEEARWQAFLKREKEPTHGTT